MTEIMLKTSCDKEKMVVTTSPFPTMFSVLNTKFVIMSKLKAFAEKNIHEYYFEMIERRGEITVY